jgi:hypothetical protein
MANDTNKQESNARQAESKGTENYGQGPGSAGPGKTRLTSDTPENRAGSLNPSAPNDATAGPSTNLGTDMEGQVATRGAAAPEEGDRKNEGTIKKPSAEKHEAA